MIATGHLRVRHETGAQAWLLVLAVLSTVIVLATFALTTLVDEPATAVALVYPGPEHRRRLRLEADPRARAGSRVRPVRAGGPTWRMA